MNVSYASIVSTYQLNTSSNFSWEGGICREKVKKYVNYG